MRWCPPPSCAPRPAGDRCSVPASPAPASPAPAPASPAPAPASPAPASPAPASAPAPASPAPAPAVPGPGPGLPGPGPGLPGGGLPHPGTALARPGLLRPASRHPGRLPEGHVELGELCRVHRGQVTGANAVWVTAGAHPLIPARFLVPAVTRARELIAAGLVLPPDARLRQVISLPADLGGLPGREQAAVARFLRHAMAAGAADSYVARHRTPWWRVRLGAPPPILASYMGRRAPVFVRNQAAASYLNIAHGLYPRDPLAPGVLDALAAFLSGSVTTGQGRVYAGGLVKFEPREMERLPVPGPAHLAAWAEQAQEDQAQEDQAQEDQAQEDQAQEDQAQEDQAQEDQAQEDQAQEDQAQEDQAQEDQAQEDQDG